MLLVLYSQALQSVVLLVVVLAASQPYSGSGLAWGTAAGAVGAAGLVAYYHALATGQTAIVAPLASSGAVLPLLVDLARGRLPGPLAMAGLVMVLAGIAVTSLASEERDDQPLAPTWHGPPATRRRAACSARRPDPPRPGRGRALRPVLRRRRPGQRDRRRERPPGRARGPARRPAHHPGRGAAVPGLAGLGIDDPALLLPVAVLTVLNLSADAFLAYAVTGGDLAVVAVLASLWPQWSRPCAPTP